MFLERFDENFPFFKFKYDFNASCYSVVCDFVKLEGGENAIISRAGNTPDIEEKHDNDNTNNMATYKEERLQGKFVNSNVINLSRRNHSEAATLRF